MLLIYLEWIVTSLIWRITYICIIKWWLVTVVCFICIVTEEHVLLSKNAMSLMGFDPGTSCIVSHCSTNWTIGKHALPLHWRLVRDSSAVRRLFVQLTGAVGCQSALQKVVLHSSTAPFSHKPYHFVMSVYFSAIKRDLVILTEWWQQHIAWWELLNAARQIISMRKQHANHMEDDIKHILQDKQFIYSSNQSRRK